MNNGVFKIWAALFAAVMTAGYLRAESPGGQRFLPDRPFEIFATAPADAVVLTPQTISNDLSKVVCVRAAIGSVSPDDLERWRALRIAVIAELPQSGARTNAVSAYLQGYAGIIAAPSPELDEGIKDVAALARHNALSHKVQTLREPDKIKTEGRRGLFEIERINVAKDDPDLTRLNAYARIRRLAAFAKEPEGITFDLNLVPRPPLVPKKFATKRREGPSPSEIENELWNRSHVLAYDAVVKFWEYRAQIAREEDLIGFPSPGVSTCCRGEAENERLFVERRLEIIRRQFGSAAEGLRCPLPRSANGAVPPKVLSETAAEKRHVYDLLPEMDLLPERVLRLRIEFMLDRLNGRPIEPLPPPPEKPLELELDGEDDVTLDRVVKKLIRIASPRNAPPFSLFLGAILSSESGRGDTWVAKDGWLARVMDEHGGSETPARITTADRARGGRLLRRQPVVETEQPTEALGLLDPARSRQSGVREQDPVVDALVIAFGVIVGHVFGHDMPQGPLPEQDQAVETLGLDRADERLPRGVFPALG